MKTGVIVLGHGSKSADSATEFEALVKMVEEKFSLDYKIIPAYMSLQEPTLSCAVNSISEHCNKIIILPCFLFKGNHIKYDIIELIDTEKVKNPNIEFVIAKHIGADPYLATILTQRIEEVL